MPRPRGPHGKDDSKPLAVRLSHDLRDRVLAAAGTTGGPELSEWVRNVLRRAVRLPLSYEVGYEEGKAAGWADANERFRAALKAGR